MKKNVLTLCVAFFCFTLQVGLAQKQSAEPRHAPHSQQPIKPPRLVIGIVVDQMKWEYLNMFRQSKGGFGKLLKKGFECSNTHLNYIPTVTAAGHSAIYTGAVPAMNGIIGNDWFERKKNKEIYCTSDEQYGMSPQNLWSSTITDELKLASNFRSKVYGVSLKDRGAILPAGHVANAAFWWNSKEGKWQTSGYYPQEEAEWIATYDGKSLADAYYKQGWTTLFRMEDYENYPYLQADYVNRALGEKGFPYPLDQFIGKDYGKILFTPGGNELTIDLAKKIITDKKLGTTKGVTDFLAVSFSSTDYVGHAFGPNSVEREDIYFRLDQSLGAFMDSVEKIVGKDVVYFLTADHGVVHIPQFLSSKKMPAQRIEEKSILGAVQSFGERIGVKKIVLDFSNSQIYLNLSADSGIGGMDREAVIARLNDFLLDSLGEQIIFAVNNHRLSQASLPEDLKEKIINGYSPTRSGDITLIYKAAFTNQYGKKGTTHFSPYKYDTHIPLLFYGMNIPKGTRNAPTRVTDIAVTIAYLLGIDAPNASSGIPIKEVVHKKP